MNLGFCFKSYGSFALSAIAVVALAIPASAAPVAANTSKVQGTLYDTGGEPASAGQLVNLVAWPKSEILSQLTAGQNVPTVIIATAKTDSGGNFSFSIPSASAVDSYTSKAGDVNFSVESMAAGLPHISAFGVAGINSGSPKISNATTSDSPINVLTNIDLSPVPHATTLSTHTVGADAAGVVSPDQGGVVCGWTDVKDYGPQWVRVGSATSVSGATANLTYSSGASSTLGVGVSSSGASGSFSASGSTTVSSNASIGMSSISSGSRAWKTEFLYSKYGYHCNDGTGYHSYQVKATAFAGGASYSSISSPSASYCTTYSAGSSFTKDTSTASTYSTGGETSGIIGVNLSASTGYTRAASLVFNFSSKHSLCGTNGYPAASPGQLVAK